MTFASTLQSPPDLSQTDQRPLDADATPVAGSRITGVRSDGAPYPLEVAADLPAVSLVPIGDPRSLSADLVVEGVLGEGGMGLVTLCRQRSLGRSVAVKSVRPPAVGAGDLRALVHEARVTGSLEHPGIVPVHQLGADADGSPVMVMKRVTGAVWSELIYDAQHPGWGRARGDRLAFHLDVLRRVCDAVHFAHSRGVIHRDLKTTNVMIGEFGEVYVLDWGIACGPGVQPGEAGNVVGTPAFMAPEMASMGADPITPRTDVYLLGAMLHEVLTGRARHDGASVLAMLNGARRSLPVRYAPNVPRELAALCNQATQRDPSERVADARAFADALSTFQEHRASDRVTEAALLRLADLRRLPPGTEPHAARQLRTEASFGFRQALELWPGNDRAASGQREVALWGLRHELSCRNLEASEALLATLDPTPEPLAFAVARLRESLAVEAHEVERLRAIAREHDPRVSAAERARVSAAMIAASAGVTALMAALRALDVVPLTHATLGGLLGVIAGVAGLLLWPRRAAFLANHAGRVLMAVPFVALGGAAVSLAVGASLGLSPGASTVTAMLLVAAVFAATAASFERRLVAVSATTLVAAVAGAAWPARALDFAALAGLAASVEVAVLFHVIARGARAEQRSADASGPHRSSALEGVELR